MKTTLLRHSIIPQTQFTFVFPNLIFVTGFANARLFFFILNGCTNAAQTRGNKQCHYIASFIVIGNQRSLALSQRITIPSDDKTPRSWQYTYTLFIRFDSLARVCATLVTICPRDRNLSLAPLSCQHMPSMPSECGRFMHALCRRETPYSSCVRYSDTRYCRRRTLR